VRPIHAAHATHKLTERKKSRRVKRGNLFDVGWERGAVRVWVDFEDTVFLGHSSRDAPLPVGFVENVVADCRLA